MRVAIIDLGTNSVRFDVHQFGPKKKKELLHREKLMVRLGQGVFSSGGLNREAVRRTVLAFQSFKKTALELRVERMVAFGTAALREASDGLQFLEEVKSKSGIEIQVISGAEEARLIALGVLKNEKVPKNRFGLIDIGGGSTEITLCKSGDILAGDSFSLGTAKLQQVFLKTIPPRPPTNGNRDKDDPEDSVETLRRYIRTTLLTKTLSERWPKVDRMFGSSGTIRSLSRLVNKKKKDKRTILKADLSRLVQEMTPMSTTELLELPGMEAKRVDMILSGAILLEECMDVFGVKEVLPTEFSLRDGILQEQYELFLSQENSTLGFHLKDIENHLTHLYQNMQHVRTVASFADQIFEGTKRLHRLDPEWKNYLRAAALLHDVGEVVSPTRHEQHSYYIAKHGDFAILEKWENDFIANLCLYHRGGDYQVPEFGKNDREKKRAFAVLLGILRVSDALDRSHSGHLKVKRINITINRISFQVQSTETPDLEMLRIDQKKNTFEKVFARELEIRWKKGR
jgi:exopolyphosphatase / guanosine-5'-triphosphate,3'-diphosphate pyrophosphatase